ncbi:hypothetical protein NLU13_0433 [Sarocladium strictum]|uniref:Peptidase A1 domain-containing protein n=1 Tax=Sarocladium strictum TaxID=5046 RepID=A0AA39GP16_SARSR|nr:hypothetical protein NLU13_0433 [Sarocladium strictum]
MKGANAFSFATASCASLTAAQTAVPEGAILVPMIRNQDQSAYFAELQVGTPPQSSWLKVDTGSPTYSFVDSQNDLCQSAKQRCERYGSYNNKTSSTSLFQGSGFHNALQSHGTGDYLSDTVGIGGVSTDHLYFGFITKFGFPDRVIGDVYSILGMSLDCGVAGPECTGKGPYVLPQLRQASSINRMVSSIYLGPDELETAYPEMILGGYYDEAKVGGDLFTLNMVDPHSAPALRQTNSVNVTAIEVIVDGAEAASGSYGEPGVGVPVLMDTGVASWYLPTTIADAIYESLGGLLDGAFNPAVPHQAIDCKYRDAENVKGSVAVHFGSVGKIEIPLHTLVTQFTDDSCATYVSSRSDTPFIFGDPFLRGVYTIFDQENWTLTMSKVNYTREQRIVPLPEGGFKA